MSDKPSEAQESLRDKILAERDKGNLVYAHIEGYAVVSVEDFVKQPVNGILYDLNRDEEVCLSFITEKKWINDFAVALTIRKLVQQRDEARARLPEVDAIQVPRDVLTRAASILRNVSCSETAESLERCLPQGERHE